LIPRDANRCLRRGLLLTVPPVVMVIVTSVALISQTSWTTVSHDLTSFLAPVTGMVQGTSGLYADYFNVTPPGVHLILLPWVWAFGPGIGSMYALHSLFITGHQTALYLVLRKWLTRLHAASILAVVSIVAISYRVFSDMLLTTELVGNTLVFLGVVITPLTSHEFRLKRWALGLTLLSFAVLVREVYVFAPILIALAFLWKFRQNPHARSAFIRLVAWATLLAASPVVVLLLTFEGLGPYLHVLRLKRTLYPPPDFLRIVLSPIQMAPDIVKMWPSLALLSLLFLVTITPAHRRFFVKVALGVALAVTIFSAAFTWQNKPIYGHYAASVLPFLSGFLAIPFVVLEKLDWRVPKVLTLALLLLPLNFTDIASDLRSLQTPRTWWSSTLGAGRIENAASNEVSDDGCSQVVYGWNPGAFYIANDTIPCTKYFLVNLIEKSPSHRTEYILEILAQPPTTVIYRPTNADLDTARFEQDVFPWRSALNACYQQESEMIFIPILSESATRKCLIQIAEKSLFRNLALSQFSMERILSGEGA